MGGFDKACDVTKHGGHLGFYQELCTYQCNAGGGGGGGADKGGGFRFLKKFAIKFPAHGQIIPVKCNQISPTPGCTLLSIPRQNPRKAE